MSPEDFIDEVIEERTDTNPDFPGMVEAAARARALVPRRRRAPSFARAVPNPGRGLDSTSGSALARLEGGETDPRISTIERYAITLGEDLELRGPRTGRISEEGTAYPAREELHDRAGLR
jgi:hypothetical protein